MPRVLQFPLLPLAQTTGTNASYCPRYHPFIANHLWHEYYYPSNWPDYNFYQHFIIVHPFTFENDPLPRLIANICLSSVYLASYLLVDWWLRNEDWWIINHQWLHSLLGLFISLLSHWAQNYGFLFNWASLLLMRYRYIRGNNLTLDPQWF